MAMAQVKIGEIFTQHPDNTGALAQLLPDIEKHMQFGLAGEDVQSHPGITLRSLLDRPGDPPNVDLRFDISQGDSLIQGAAGQNLHMVAFGDGSVRSVSPGVPLHFRFEDGSFFADLQQVGTSNRVGNAWAGPVKMNDGNGNAIIAILIGLLLPAVQNHGPTFDGMIIVGEGSGLFHGAPGVGTANFEFGEQGINGTFAGRVSTKAFEVRSRGR